MESLSFHLREFALRTDFNKICVSARFSRKRGLPFQTLLALSAGSRISRANPVSCSNLPHHSYATFIRGHLICDHLQYRCQFCINLYTIPLTELSAAQWNTKYFLHIELYDNRTQRTRRHTALVPVVFNTAFVHTNT